jgi:hypothetical protein
MRHRQSPSRPIVWREAYHTPSAAKPPRLVLALLTIALALPARAAEPAFTPSYLAGTRDAAGARLGGTEMRALASHAGRLFAGNGYWKDDPGFDGAPGAQILVLDAPGGAWRVDHEFTGRMPRGRPRHLAVSALQDVTFHTDGQGAPLAAPVTLLLASTWDLTGARSVFVRDDRTGAWAGTQLAQDRDRQTGADLVFAGDSRGIFAGAYDPAGRIVWTLEWATADRGLDRFPGLSGRLRISSFAEADDRLFAAIGQQIWVRQDGPSPQWQLFYTNPAPHYSQTGLRGLTTLTEPGGAQALLAAVEGAKSRIVRIDPATGQEATDLDLAGFLDTQWQTRVSYVIAAYNGMAASGADLVIGLEAFIPPAAPRPPGHTLLPVNGGLEAGGWLLIRHPGGHYDLHRVTAAFPGIGDSLVAVRTAAASPFPSEAGVLYTGGYDANGAPAHDTAWIARMVATPDH